MRLITVVILFLVTAWLMEGKIPPSVFLGVGGLAVYAIRLDLAELDYWRRKDKE